MKKKCECGHIHCCHDKTKDKEVTDPETGLVFIRTTCADPDCQHRLGDSRIN